MKTLRIALPAGSMQEAILDLLRKAGYQVFMEGRSLFPRTDDEELDFILLRPQEIPSYVAQGKLDVGVAGWDCIVECDCEKRVSLLGELTVSKVSRRPLRWVLAVPQGSPVRSAKDLEGKLIATEFVRMARKWLKRIGVSARIEYSWGATEAKAGRLCDAVIEATETGTSLWRCGLEVIDEVLQSTTRLMANRASMRDAWKREKAEDFFLMLRGVLDAEGNVLLAFNVQEPQLKAAVALVPALQSPTICPLVEAGWRSVSTIVVESVVRTIIPRLKRAGARDIVVLPISKMIR